MKKLKFLKYAKFVCLSQDTCVQPIFIHIFSKEVFSVGGNTFIPSRTRQNIKVFNGRRTTMAQSIGSPLKIRSSSQILGKAYYPIVLGCFQSSFQINPKAAHLLSFYKAMQQSGMISATFLAGDFGLTPVKHGIKPTKNIIMDGCRLVRGDHGLFFLQFAFLKLQKQ